MKYIMLKRRLGHILGKIFIIPLYLSPIFICRILIDLFNHSSTIIGYGVRWAAYKRLCLYIGNRVSFEPNSILRFPENLSIGDNVVIHPGTLISCSSLVIIGSDCAIAPNVSILTEEHHHGQYYNGKRAKGVSSDNVVIEANVFLGVGVVVTKGVTIYRGGVIGANSVVISDTKPYSMYAGNPCVFKKQYNVTGGVE